METIWDSHLNEKLRILAYAAKYDAACTSSGGQEEWQHGEQAMRPVVSVIVFLQTEDAFLLKILLTNDCCYDCVYCQQSR